MSGAHWCTISCLGCCHSTPSVYVAIEVHKGGFGKPMVIGFSGHIYFDIRSRKHSSSNDSRPFTHALDFNKLVHLNEFRDLAKTDLFIKPVVILSVDGGLDEYLRYQNVLFIICAN